jgi:outer membrane receptor for ferrienterochelin and colicin
MRRFSSVIPFLFLALAAPLALAQTTGDITGHVTDEQGGALPGVTVEARGPALQGARTAVTDATGAYHLVLLPPGSYKVTAALQSFARVEKTVVVSLARTATADINLKPSTTAEVTVTGQAPIVDTTSTDVGENFDSRQIRALPTGRNYSSVVLVAPGVTEQSSNSNNFAGTIAIYGSAGLENNFILDGANTTGIEYGAQGTNLNFEFIQEVEVKAGGYQAEFGRSTGGIINVITKSGGNEFHGDAFGYYNADSLQASNKYPNENLYGTNQGFSRYDYGADVGGYLWKDRIWLFGAYDRVQGKVLNELTTGPAVGDIVSSPSVQNLLSAKLTINLNASNSLVGSFFQDPSTQTGAINDGAHTLNGDPSTFLGRQDLGGQNWVARYNGIFGSSWVVSAQYAQHQERNSVGPATVPGAGIQYIDSRPGADNFQSGGFGLIQNKEFTRDSWGASATKYLSNHEIKGGFEYETEDATVIKRMSGGLPGGQQVKIIENPGDPSNPVYRHFYWTTPDASLPDNVPLSRLNATPSHTTISAYLQDAWTVLPNLTVNFGVRWDQQKIYDSAGTQQINLNDEFAPRIGVIWDPFSDHKTRVYGSFGYFYEQTPMDLVIRSFSYERQPVIYNFSPTDTTPNLTAAQIAQDDGAIANGGGKILGGFQDLADPNIKGQYLREFLFGLEKEVMPNLAVGGKYIYRNYGRVIEDFVCSNAADYCIGNPGQGQMSTLYDLNYIGGYPTPKAQRIYRGAELDITKQFSNNWSMVLSYLWSNMTGNFDGGFAPYTQPFGTADPNISAAYDYYDFFTKGPVPCAKYDTDGTTCLKGGTPYPYSATGHLSNDRTNQVKLYGTYVTPFNLNLGLTAYYRTGTPVSRLGYSVAYDRWEFFLSQRGTDGRVPADYEVDLHFGYPLQLGPVTVNALVDIFDILNAQRPIFLDERYNTSQFDDPAYICGSQPGSVDQGRCNTYYKTPLARTLPRSVRFGLRVTF